MIDRNLLETKDINGIGYAPLFDFGEWRVAILRFIDELIPDRINYLERHLETDEIFILVDGKAILLIGEGEDGTIGIQSNILEKGKVYNVKRNAWHSCLLSRDASIILVENRDTSSKNTEYMDLENVHREYILDLAKKYKFS